MYVSVPDWADTAMFVSEAILNVLPIQIRVSPETCCNLSCHEPSSRARTHERHSIRQGRPAMTVLAEHAGQGAEAA